MMIRCPPFPKPCVRGEGGGGGGLRNRKVRVPKKSIGCLVNFICSRHEIWVEMGGGGAPAEVASRSKTSLCPPFSQATDCWCADRSGTAADGPLLKSSREWCRIRTWAEYVRVYALVWVCTNNWSTFLVPRHLGNADSADESGTVVPLLTRAASAPWCPSHASTEWTRQRGGQPPTVAEYTM